MVNAATECNRFWAKIFTANVIEPKLTILFYEQKYRAHWLSKLY